MHVIVVGCGRVGAEAATRLTSLGHSVAIIDKRLRAFDRLPAGFPGRLVVGFGFDRDHLAEAGIAEATALAAVTSGDNTNILTARIARETFEVPNVVARIYDPRRAVIYERLGIPTVATVTWTTDQVLRRLVANDSAVDWTDPSGELQIVERVLPKSWAGASLDPLVHVQAARMVALTRNGHPRLVGPGLIGQEGDVLHFAVMTEERASLDDVITAGPGVH